MLYYIRGEEIWIGLNWTSNEESTQCYVSFTSRMYNKHLNTRNLTWLQGFIDHRIGDPKIYRRIMDRDKSMTCYSSCSSRAYSDFSECGFVFAFLHDALYMQIVFLHDALQIRPQPLNPNLDHACDLRFVFLFFYKTIQTYTYYFKINTRGLRELLKIPFS